MGQIRASRPSAAMLVAVLALVAALAGTAVAGSDVQSSAINKKKVKKIADKEINKLAPGLSVAHAATANNATSADNADKLDGLDAAALQEPKGTANVERGATPSFDASYPVKGFTAVSQPSSSPGIYCLAPTGGIDPDSDPATLSIEWSQSDGNDLLAYWDASGNDCPVNNYQVRTYDFPAGTTALSNDVSFLITVL